MRGRKQHLLSNKNRKQFADKRAKPRKRVKLSSEDWYQKAAAALSIRNSLVTPSPSLVPEID